MTMGVFRENSDIREFSEFRDIMERGAGAEYALRWGGFLSKYCLPPKRGKGTQYAPLGSASFLKYTPRWGVGGVVIATSLLNTTPPSAGYSPKCAGWAHKHTKTRTKGLCADVRDVRSCAPF